MVPIIYGKPTDELIEAARFDVVVLGGTKVKEFTHFCFNCQETYPLPEA